MLNNLDGNNVARFAGFLLTGAVVLAGGDPRPPSVELLSSPASAASMTPHLTTGPEGEILLSWQERLDDGSARLRFARRTSTGWSSPLTIASSRDWFVNWADFPALAVLDSQRLAAHWLAKNGAATYAYDIELSLSSDGGATWSGPIRPHKDNTQTEHGFVSYFAWDSNRLGLVWLDGRAMQGDSHGGQSPGAMSLRYAELDAGGRILNSAEIDDRVCECCQTAAVRTASGALTAYRDRSDDEIRDIGIAVHRQGAWSKTRIASEDGWKIPGCPVNGPALAARGDRVALAWFTLAQDEPRVRLAFSDDGGLSFDEPVTVNSGDTIGRVDVELLKDGAAVVSRLESLGNDADHPAIRVSRIGRDGARAWDLTISHTKAARASGFPRLALGQNEVLIAWTDASRPPQVKVARIVD